MYQPECTAKDSKKYELDRLLILAHPSDMESSRVVIVDSDSSQLWSAPRPQPRGGSS